MLRLLGAVTVTARHSRDPDIYRPVNGEFRVSRSDTGGGAVGTGWDRTRASKATAPRTPPVPLGWLVHFWLGRVLLCPVRLGPVLSG